MQQLQQIQQQAQLQAQKHWERLFLTVIEMSEEELRAALQSKQTDLRFAAAYAVGERLLDWHKDLVPLLEDRSNGVRQAARRSLVILSFLELNPDEARRLRSARRSGEPTPLAKLQGPVDFGPNPGASRSAQSQAARQWTDWWTDREPKQSRLVTELTTADRTPESEQLADDLARAARERRQDLLTKYRDGKGVHYTEALAFAGARASGDARREIRETLVDRLARMKETSLVKYLEDEDAEIRRAAPLALARRANKSAIGSIIGLLLDPQPSVERAAHAALCGLSGEDFGPGVNATEAEKTEAALRWRKWWEASPSRP